MKFSAQEEYGPRCLMTIAQHGSLTIPEISRLEGLSQPHTAKLLAILRKSEYIKSTRGQAGGYALARLAETIVIGDVLALLGGRLLEEGFCERHAGTSKECAHATSCSLAPLWTRVQSAVDAVLDRMTLADLLDAKPMSGENVRLFIQPRRARSPLTLEAKV